MDCASCGSPMISKTVDARFGATAGIDYCPRCQVVWFDGHESLQLSPGATLKLFTIIGQHAAKGRPTLQQVIKCPRCGSQLLLTHDLQRGTRFEYWRCPHGHGRLITFYDFLREKEFIRPLSPRQLSELRENIRTVNCAGCGAPIDLTTQSTCAHCGAPLTMLDMSQPERLIAELRRADRPEGSARDVPSRSIPETDAGSDGRQADPTVRQKTDGGPDER
jgi:hypothetical protein